MSNIDRLPLYAWYQDNSNGFAPEVGCKIPNEWGIFDMYGNVLEMCLDVVPSVYSDKLVDPKSFLEFETFNVTGGHYDSDAATCLSTLKRPIYIENGFQEPVGLRLIFK